MKKSTKAVLLSALVFPGVGHIYLKKHISGTVLIGTAFAAIYFLVSITIEKALQITEKIQSGDIPLDIAAITESISKQSTGAEAQLVNLATATFIICWLIGIVDCYRQGRVREKTEEDFVGK